MDLEVVSFMFVFLGSVKAEKQRVFVLFIGNFTYKGKACQTFFAFSVKTPKKGL